MGLQGATGAQGPKGDKGDTGATGPAGMDGAGADGELESKSALTNPLPVGHVALGTIENLGGELYVFVSSVDQDNKISDVSVSNTTGNYRQAAEAGAALRWRTDNTTIPTLAFTARRDAISTPAATLFFTFRASNGFYGEFGLDRDSVNDTPNSYAWKTRAGEANLIPPDLPSGTRATVEFFTDFARTMKFKIHDSQRWVPLVERGGIDTGGIVGAPTAAAQYYGTDESASDVGFHAFPGFDTDQLGFITPIIVDTVYGVTPVSPTQNVEAGTVVVPGITTNSHGTLLFDIEWSITGGSYTIKANEAQTLVFTTIAAIANSQAFDSTSSAFEGVKFASATVQYNDLDVSTVDAYIVRDNTGAIAIYLTNTGINDRGQTLGFTAQASVSMDLLGTPCAAQGSGHRRHRRSPHCGRSVLRNRRVGFRRGLPRLP